MRRSLFDFTTERGESVIQRWAKGENLGARDRAALNEKLDWLSQIDFDLAKGTRLLVGPVLPEIYKLRVFGSVMLRPFLCRGPKLVEVEYTLLTGAIERNNALRPSEWKRAADGNLRLLKSDQSRRSPHVRL